jgi:hypothetical protein
LWPQWVGKRTLAIALPSSPKRARWPEPMPLHVALYDVRL